MEQDGDMKEEEHGKRGKGKCQFHTISHCDCGADIFDDTLCWTADQSGWFVHGKYPYQWR